MRQLRSRHSDERSVFACPGGSVARPGPDAVLRVAENVVDYVCRQADGVAVMEKLLKFVDGISVHAPVSPEPDVPEAVFLDRIDVEVRYPVRQNHLSLVSPIIRLFLFRRAGYANRHKGGGQ